MDHNIAETALEQVVGGGKAEYEQYIAEMCKKYGTTRDTVMARMTNEERKQAILLEKI